MSARYYTMTATIITAPNDSSDGRDPIGAALTTAAWDDTAKTLTQSGAFSAYTHAAGHVIYVASSTSSLLTAGLFVVASKTDSNVIVLALLDEDPANPLAGTWGGGNDTNVVTSTGPFATAKGGIETMSAAGDECWVDSGTTWAPTTAIVLPVVSNEVDPPRIIGCDADGVENVWGTRNTITGTSLGAGLDLMTGATGVSMTFKHMRLTAGKTHNLDVGANGAINLIDCRVDNAANNGFNASSTSVAGYSSEIDNNGGHGVITQGSSYFSFCSIHDNTNDGLNNQNGIITIANSFLYGNGDQGMHFTGARYVVNNSVVANNGGAGIQSDTTPNGIITNSFIALNGDYGLKWGTSTSRNTLLVNVVFYSNTTGSMNRNTEYSESHNCIFTGTDPFTDSANDDYSLDGGESSDYYNAALGNDHNPISGNEMFMDIGPVQFKPAGGGSPSGVRNPLQGPIG